jgi:hypothetical protein
MIRGCPKDSLFIFRIISADVRKLIEKSEQDERRAEMFHNRG